MTRTDHAIRDDRARRQGTWELLARCREIAVQLRDIGEDAHADDIEALFMLYVKAEGGRPG